MDMSTDITGVVKRFMLAGDLTIDQYNIRQTALYIGLQLEEMAEKLEALNSESLDFYIKQFHDLSKAFKSGQFDTILENSDRKSMLDADVDLAWVTLGSSFSQGADVHGAIREVATANLNKIFPDGKMHKNEYGKIIKPEGWTAPDLTNYVNNN